MRAETDGAERKCTTCRYYKKFSSKRPDEPTDGGCTKRNWEGYTSDEHPFCGLTFWEKRCDTGKEKAKT